MVLARYQSALRQPHVARLLLTSVIARLPQGMSGLAIILFLTPEHGYGRAGFATGISVAGAGVSSVALARAVDRIGARWVLAPASTLYALAMLGLALSRDHGYGLQVGICAVIGLVTPPVSAVARGLWSQLLDEGGAQALFGLEATVQELIYISGPALVALIAGGFSARTAVILSGAMGIVGALSYVSAAPFRSDRRQRRTGPRQRVLFGTSVLRYVIVAICVTVAFGITDISTVDFVGGRSASASAGVVLAVWSVGSMIGGLLFGAATSAVTNRVLATVVTIVGSGLALASLSPNSVGLAVILFGSGMAIAPMMARLYALMAAAAGDASKTEAFGWLAVGFLVGTSLGSAVGGVSIDALGARWTFIFAGLAALCAVPVLVLRRQVTSMRVR